MVGYLGLGFVRVGVSLGAGARVGGLEDVALLARGVVVVRGAVDLGLGFGLGLQLGLGLGFGFGFG